MPSLMETVAVRLCGKGLSPQEAERLVRDVSTITFDKKEISIDSLKKALAAIGWKEHILDNHTLWQILSLLE
jgi:hypothetical protein